MNSLKDAEEYLKTRKQYGIKPGLARVEALLVGLDHPESALKAVHVAGTNGKGSTIAFLNHALIQNGYKTGIFTSPSFHGLKGYFLLNDEFLKDEIIVEGLHTLIPSIQELDDKGNAPTEYEILTALAFLLFKDRADITLIETAMGGRYDTTNVVHPLISIITNVEKDHMIFLGNTIAEIAAHKAGIIKRKVPVILGLTNEEAFKVIEREAISKEAPISRLGTDFFINGHTFCWESAEDGSVKLEPSMKGEHQQINAAVAYTALIKMKELGYSLDESKSLTGIQRATLPGRYETVCANPQIILDSAHNIAGIETLLKTMNAERNTGKKHLIFAGFKDKQLAAMLKLTETYFDKLTITSFAHERAALLKDFDISQLHQHIDMSDDWQHILDCIMADKSNQTSYYIAGSLHFITIVREYILKNYC